MISRIEASNYRCFRELNQSVEPLQILVGPNGSGKSTFLDVIAFLGTLSSESVQSAVEERSENFHDLVWGREGRKFAIAIEARVPEGKYPESEWPAPVTIRYEIGLQLEPASETVAVGHERLIVKGSDPVRRRMTTVLRREAKQSVFRAEIGNQIYSYDLHQNYTGLNNLPVDETAFPAAAWLKALLREGVRKVSLDTELLRSASPPNQRRAVDYDGWNLPRLVARVTENPAVFDRWLAHLRTALPDLETVRTSFRPEDKYRYLILRFASGVDIPQWLVSDGTLRLLALTIIPYLNEQDVVYLVEEPETGVHPTALETIFQSLSSVYDGQVIMTSHSPLLLALAKPEQLMCFTKTSEGVEVIRGDQHPALRDWTCDVNLSDLFASGVLG